MKRVLIGAIGIAALTSLGFVTPAHAVSHSVSINVMRPSTAAGQCVRNGGSASGDAMSASGTINLNRYPCANGDPRKPTGGSDGDMVGQVKCLSVSGNQAILSGTVSSATGYFNGATTFQEFVRDNSSPSSPSNPDTDVLFNQTGVTCASPGPVQGAPVTTGDIRVS